MNKLLLTLTAVAAIGLAACGASPKPCATTPATHGRWRIGPGKFMSANAPWRASLFASWA